MAMTSEQASRIGRMGGEATKRKMLKQDPDYYSTIGLKGGEAMFNKHGRDHYSRIGQIKAYKKDQLAAQKEANGGT